MSAILDDPTHELETEDLLLEILRELRHQTLIMQEAFGQHDIKKDDLDE